MSRIEIFVVPDLYTSYRKLVTHLAQSDCEELFLNQPKNLEQFLLDLAKGSSYKEVINQIKEEELIPELVNSWRYPVEPLLTSLPDLKTKKERLTIHCYIDPGYHTLRIDKASEIARLTLRSNITGKMDTEEWETAVRDWLNEKPEELEKEADFIDRRAEEKTVCVSGYDGKSLQKLLKEKNHAVTRTEVEEVYHPKPLHTLENELEKNDQIKREHIKEFIKRHIEYVKGYILRNKNLDQAHWKWSWNNFSDVRERYNPQVIEMLGHIRLIEL